MSAILSARSITKTFPGVVALRDVSFDLQPGEIHAVCGENGAGKSTLIKLLSGIHPHGSYEGELEVAGRVARFHGIADAERAGIAVIYQELALVDELTVAENIFLGAEPRFAWYGNSFWHDDTVRGRSGGTFDVFCRIYKDQFARRSAFRRALFAHPCWSDDCELAVGGNDGSPESDSVVGLH